MLNLLKVEIYKLKTSKTIWGILLICLIQSILCPMLFSKTLTGKIVLRRVLGSQLFLGWFVLIAVFMAIYIGDEFSSSCSSGYIKNLIIYGHERYKIVISKFIGSYLGIIIISLVTPMVVTAINTFINGYGETFTFSSLKFILRVIILMTFIYTGIGSIGIVILFISRNGIFAEVIFVMVDILNRISLMFAMTNPVVDKIYSNTVFGQVNTALSQNITFLQGIKVIVISLITIGISIYLSIYFFKRADIK